MKKLKMKSPLNFHVGQVVCVLPYLKHKGKNNEFYNQSYQKIEKIVPWANNRDLGWCLIFSNGDECHFRNVRALKLLEVGPYEKA